MTVMNEKEAADKKVAVQQVCTLLFPDDRVLFTPRSIMISRESGSVMIDESNFEFL
jgi:hypothetical protein